VLEQRIAAFLGTEASLTYGSCWSANEGLLPSLVQDGDVIVSDELNHASIIDAGRLSRQAMRRVFPHSDMAALEAMLTDTPDAAVTIVITDGVFSMEGDVAQLPEMAGLCQRCGATLVVDDSHAVGVLGARGRGTPEHYGLSDHGPDGVQILTGTLGKALGGAAGGYVAGPQDVIDYLIQRSRPQLFSNALPPTVACSASKALDVLEREPERVAALHDNVDTMRRGLRELDYEVLESPSAILPIIIGDSAETIRLSRRLLDAGVFVTGFGFPVVPEGRARLRVQMSAVHTSEQIGVALEAFRKLQSHR
jgi:glycine C-acetyltransferase